MTIKAPADKRFRRAQVKPARRRRSWGRIVRVAVTLVVSGLVVSGGVRAIGLVARSTVLRVSHIVVRGNHRLSTGEVLAVLSGIQGENILTVQLDSWRRRLLLSPWVRDAALRRVLPSTIEVAISERSPIGIARVDAQLYLVDASGSIIDEYGPHHSEFDLPIIDGLTSTDDGREASLASDRAALAARLVEAIGGRKDLARRISQVDVRDPHDAVVILEHDPALVHLGESRFLERLTSYVELAPTLRARVPQIDYVDLRFDDRLYVRPAGVAAHSGRAPGSTGSSTSIRD